MAVSIPRWQLLGISCAFIISQLVIVVPIAYTWVLEIAISSGPMAIDCDVFGPVQNGVVSWDGCVAYHFWMYATFLVCGIASLAISLLTTLYALDQVREL
jgi:hypothetical protein